MAKSKHGKALVVGALAMTLSCSMLVGTTFAWFTDSVTSGNNVIMSGNLDVELEYWDGSSWKNVGGSDKVLTNMLWEPGATEVAYLRLTNAGSLALKYEFGINIVSETKGTNVADKEFKLSDYIYYGVVEGVNGKTGAYATREEALAAVTDAKNISASYLKQSTLQAENELYMALVVYMPTTVGNEANHKTGTPPPQINLGINVLATQLDSETDSFGSDYDKGLVFEKVVSFGSWGGIEWTLTDKGKLSVAPASAPVPDENSGAPYAVGVWREAVVYNSSGGATAIGGHPYDVNKVKSLVIAEGITSIGSFAAKFPNLTGEVVIPSTVTYIGQEAFQNARITKLTFAKGGTETLCIAPGAFKKLEIKELVFPDDREVHVHCWAFNDCTKLETVTIPATVTTFSVWTHVDYCGMNYVNGWDSQVFARCNNLKTINFGSQEVFDRFRNASGNKANINSIGGVVCIVNGVEVDINA